MVRPKPEPFPNDWQRRLLLWLGGCLLLLSSLTYLALSFFHPMKGPHDPRFSLWLIHLALFALPLLISIVVTLWYARRI